MKRAAWILVLASTVLTGTVGCGDDDGGGTDAGAADPDGGALGCGSPGTAGGHCDGTSCGGDLQCVRERLVNASDNRWFPATADNDEDPRSFTRIESPRPEDQVTISFATGSLCVDQCDATAAADTCGTCAKCSDDIGEDVLGIPAWFFFASANREFGLDTGICRAHCEFDPETNGGCPDGFTCDAFTNLCFEECRSDAACNAILIVNDEGELGTWVNPSGGRTCSETTGRCEWNGPPDAAVGDACERQADCATDVGICLGGTCGELQCDPEADEGVCAGGDGMCLTVGGNSGTVCVQGCNSAMDCRPGNGCVPLDDGATIGSFSGYCLNVCDTDMANADDDLVECRSGEACDIAAPTDDEPDPDGRCIPTCDPMASPTTCGAGEICEQVDGETYGFCRRTDDVCFDSSECFDGQVCDNRTTLATYGRCVDACTADSCTAGSECVASGDLAGLCAIPCGMIAGGGDAGVDAGSDAGAEDAGVEDAGVEDAGAEDAGAEDAGAEDAGVDAGVDAGRVDAGSDAGTGVVRCPAGFGCSMPAGMTTGFCVDP